eukprot:5197771-Amphidinium_carterae.1
MPALAHDTLKWTRLSKKLQLLTYRIICELDKLPRFYMRAWIVNNITWLSLNCLHKLAFLISEGVAVGFTFSRS